MDLSEIIKQTLNLDINEQTNELKLEEIDDWDSLAHMNLIANIENEFGIELTGEEIASMEKIGDIKEVINKKIKK